MASKGRPSRGGSHPDAAGAHHSPRGVRWFRAAPDDSVATAALSFIGSGIILHVGIGLRWPFATKT